MPTMMNPPETTAPTIVEVALHEERLGICEATGTNDGVPAVRYMRGDKLPWCAAFVLYCIKHATEYVDVVPTTQLYYDCRAVKDFEARMKKLELWLPPTARPEPNDIVFFLTRGASDPATSKKKQDERHAGIVVSCTDTELVTIEGNVGNRVQRLVYVLTGGKMPARVTGFGRVPRKADQVGPLL